MAFIVFEGLDGAGKSTLIKGLVQKLESENNPYILTREPGGTPLAESVRELLLSTEGEAPCAKAELLLYEAGRAQHVDKVIRPSLAENKWVVCDRYYASTFAFQAGGRGLEEDEIHWLNRFAISGCEPDLWVLLDITVEESFHRMEKRVEQTAQELDRFEQEHRSFHDRVRQNYLKQAQAQSEKWLVLDATLSPEDLVSSMLSQLEERGFFK